MVELASVVPGHHGRCKILACSEYSVIWSDKSVLLHFHTPGHTRSGISIKWYSTQALTFATCAAKYVVKYFIMILEKSLSRQKTFIELSGHKLYLRCILFADTFQWRGVYKLYRASRVNSFM